MNIDEYKVDIAEGTRGEWRVKRFKVSAEDEKWEKLRAMISHSSRGRYTPKGDYTGLYHKDHVVMSDTPDEIRDHLYAIRRATGNVLINGLGLGVVLQGIARKEIVAHIDVVEISQDVIELVWPKYESVFGNKITLIHSDAMDYNPPRNTRYDVVWHDIWTNICLDNLTSMKILHRRYGHYAKWQGSWGRELCER